MGALKMGSCIRFAITLHQYAPPQSGCLYVSSELSMFTGAQLFCGVTLDQSYPVRSNDKGMTRNF